jgi:hypothetical protein
MIVLLAVLAFTTRGSGAWYDFIIYFMLYQYEKLVVSSKLFS